MTSTDHVRLDPKEWEKTVQRVVDADRKDWQDFFGAQIDLMYLIWPTDGTTTAIPDSLLKPEIIAFRDAVHMSVMMGNGVLGVLDSSCDGLSILLRAIRSFRVIGAMDHLSSIEPYEMTLRQLGVDTDQPVPDSPDKGIELFPFDQWDKLYAVHMHDDYETLEERPHNSIHDILQRYVKEHIGAFLSPML